MGPLRTGLGRVESNVMSRWTGRLLFLMGLELAGAAAVQAGEEATLSEDGRVQWAAALSSPGAIKGGDAATVELSGTIREGWHVYALTQPAGGPTALRVTVDDNEIALATGAPSGTPPQKRHDPSFGIETRFYTHAFTIHLPVQVKQQPTAGQQGIPVSVRFQTCSDRECQPPTTTHLLVPVDVSP